MQIESSLLSIGEAAKNAGCNAQKIHRAIRRRELKAKKVGWNWVIVEQDLIDYLDSQKVKE